MATTAPQGQVRKRRQRDPEDRTGVQVLLHVAGWVFFGLICLVQMKVGDLRRKPPRGHAS